MSRLYALLVLAIPLALIAERKPITLDSIGTARERAAEPGPPVWAPDGKRFVFTQDGKIWLYDVPARARTALFSMHAMARAAVVPAAAEALIGRTGV